LWFALFSMFNHSRRKVEFTLSNNIILGKVENPRSDRRLACL
jgi:hypothetical protein